MSKIIGATVGTPMKPQKVVEKTKLEERVDKLSRDIAELKEYNPITWKGEWVENGHDGKGYKENDIVSCNGNLYIAHTDLSFEDPIKYGADWGLLLPKGYTPQKGVDYFTEADKAELVTNVLNALPTWRGGAY